MRPWESARSAGFGGGRIPTIACGMIETLPEVMKKWFVGPRLGSGAALSDGQAHNRLRG